ncbi:Peptidyl-prolyl cis-trans isomerase-like 4 [Chamberlinius hualienensis]
MSVVIETTMGDITVDLYIKERPRTCLNFLKLCKIKYYNFCLVHFVQRNFLVQMGDPTGTGRGGDSVFRQLYGDQAQFFEAETKPKLNHTKLGTLSMVNNGDGMHGSQFFITTGENLDYLDGVHTVFGEVTEGLEALLKIDMAIADEKYRPYKDIRIAHTVILDDPFDDPQGLSIPDASPLLTLEKIKSDRIGIDENLDEYEGMTMEEVDEIIQDKEATARATILEMVGDLPEADVKPPENVLFICKLNPVTNDDDLRVIFSRFGNILTCEVIRDKKSGESLQYAFIEFEKEEDCENAYFKMDNVLIDDRRIHVDFSQSVSKLGYIKDGKKVSWHKAFFNRQLALKEPKKPQKQYEMIFDDEDNKKDAGKSQLKSRYEGQKARHSNEHRRRSRSRDRGDYRRKEEHRRHKDSSSRSHRHHEDRHQHRRHKK